MKLITRMLLGLIAVVATLFIAAAFLVSTIDSTRHKDRIQQFVFDQTGRSLEIRGRIDAQLFPWVGFALHDVSLAGTEGFVNQDFASVQHVEARVRVLPLIAGNVSIKYAHLRGLELDLQRNRKGRSNWDDLMSNTSVVTTDVTNDDVIQEIEAGTPVVAALSVGQLVVSDSVVHWRDAMAGSEYDLSDFSLSTDEIKLSEPFRFKTGFEISDLGGIPKTRFTVSGLAGIDLAENIYRVDSLQLDSLVSFADEDTSSVAADANDFTDENATTAVRPADSESTDRRLTLRYTGSVVADLNTQRLDLAPLSLEVEGVVLNGEVHVTDLFEDAGVFGYVDSESVDASAMLEARGIALPETFNRALLQDVRFSANFKRSEENFLINDVSFGNEHVALNGNFQVANFQRAPVLTGTISSNTIDPGLWADAIGFTAPDNTALTQVRIAADIRQSGQLLVLNDIQLILDDTTVSGDVEFVKTDDDQYPIRFELLADTINFDSYFHGGAALDSFSSMSGMDTSLPVEMINNMDIRGELSAAMVRWSGLEFTDVSLPVQFGQGRVEGRELKATTYNGTLFATSILDVTPEEPLLTTTISLNAVDLKPILDATLQRNSSLSGTGIVNLDLLSRGATVSELAKRAGGALNLRITDGAIESVNFANQLVQLLSQRLSLDESVGAPESTSTESVNSNSNSSLSLGQNTRLDEMSMSWELANGRLYSDDLDLRASGLRISGIGALDLERKSIDYLLQPAIVEAVEADAADDSDSSFAPEHERMIGVTLPLVIRGPVKLLYDDLFGQLNSSLKSVLENAEIFGAEPGADISVIKDRLAERNTEAAASIKLRLNRIRDVTRDAQQQRNKVRQESSTKGQESSTKVQESSTVGQKSSTVGQESSTIIDSCTRFIDAGISNKRTTIVN